MIEPSARSKTVPLKSSHVMLEMVRDIKTTGVRDGAGEGRGVGNGEVGKGLGALVGRALGAAVGGLVGATVGPGDEVAMIICSS